MTRLIHVCRVTATVHMAVQDLEIAIGVLANADPADREAIDVAFSRVALHRKELYEYIEGLEADAGKLRSVMLRF